MRAGGKALVFENFEQAIRRDDSLHRPRAVAPLDRQLAQDLEDLASFESVRAAPLFRVVVRAKHVLLRRRRAASPHDPAAMIWTGGPQPIAVVAAIGDEEKR